MLLGAVAVHLVLNMLGVVLLLQYKAEDSQYRWILHWYPSSQKEAYWRLILHMQVASLSERTALDLSDWLYNVLEQEKKNSVCLQYVCFRLLKHWSMFYLNVSIVWNIIYKHKFQISFIFSSFFPLQKQQLRLLHHKLIIILYKFLGWWLLEKRYEFILHTSSCVSWSLSPRILRELTFPPSLTQDKFTEYYTPTN